MMETFSVFSFMQCDAEWNLYESYLKERKVITKDSRWDIQGSVDVRLETGVYATTCALSTDMESHQQELACDIARSYLASECGELSEQMFDKNLNLWIDQIDKNPLYLFEAASIASDAINTLIN